MGSSCQPLYRLSQLNTGFLWASPCRVWVFFITEIQICNHRVLINRPVESLARAGLSSTSMPQCVARSMAADVVFSRNRSNSSSSLLDDSLDTFEFVFTNLPGAGRSKGGLDCLRGAPKCCVQYVYSFGPKWSLNIDLKIDLWR